MKFHSNHLALMAFLALAMVIAPKANAQDTSDAVRKAVEAAQAEWAAAFNKGDIDTVVSLYTDDAQLLPEGSEAIKGRAAIRKYLQDTRNTALSNTISFRNFEIYGQGKIASEVAEILIQDGSGKIINISKQILILRHENGGWKIHRDIWTNNAPAK